MKSRATLCVLLLAAALACDEGPADIADLRDARYELRAYEGAPPVVPHELAEIGRENCLSCHKAGNARKYGRFAGVTPHPEFLNCRQCHVARAEEDLFKKNGFDPFRIETSLPNVQPLGPPYIPHGLQNRENCRSCHEGPSAPVALIPAHGPRENCRQCHVPRSPVPGFPGE